MGSPSHVLIYYANDTTYSIHYRRIVTWLRERDEEEYSDVADRVEEDIQQFPWAVDRDLGAIWRGILSARSDLSETGIVVLTNGNALQGKMFYGDAGCGAMKAVEIPVFDYHREHFRIHPLSHTETLSAILQVVASLFGVEGVQYSLITKAHGNENLAMTSLFSGMLDYETSQEFFAELDRDKSMIEKCFAGWQSKGTVGDNSGLGFMHLGAIQLRELVNGIGTDKPEYLAILKAAGDMGMQFGQVVMESCESHLVPSLVEQIPDNVNGILTAVEPVPYSSIDYRGIFEQCGRGVPLDDALREKILAPFQQQARR